MDELFIALTLSGCLLCFVVPCASLFGMFMVVNSQERRAHPANAHVAPVPQPAHFAQEHPVPSGVQDFDLEVDPHDAARTDQMLRELIATRGLKEW